MGDNIKPKVIKSMMKYYDDPEFVPEVVKKVSTAATGLCMWCRAMKVYDEVAKDVEPKKAKLAEMNALLAEADAKLKAVQAELKEVEDNVASLQRKLDDAVAEKSRLEEAADTTQKRLV